MDIKSKINSYKDDIINDIAELVKIRSVKGEACEGMPFGKECAHALNKALEIAGRMGFETVNLDNYAGYAQMGEGEDIIGILCHVDVVPEGGGWTHEPYCLSEENGVLYARGVVDDKGPLIAALYAMKIAREIKGEVFKKRIRLVIGADEESGFGCVKYYKSKEGGFSMGFSPDADFPLIFGEKGHYDTDISAPLAINAGRRVIQRIQAGTARNAAADFCEAVICGETKTAEAIDKFLSYLSAYEIDGNAEILNDGVSFKMAGKAAHASTPELGKNAACHMIKFLGEIVHDSPFVNTFNKLIGTDTSGEKIGAAACDEYGSLTLNVGMVKTDKQGTATATLDIRYPVSIDFAPYAEIISEKIKGAGAEEKFVSHSLPLLVDPESELVKNLMEAYCEVTKDTKAKPIVIGGGTYARAFENVVAFGPEFADDDNRIHDSDENIRLDRLWTAIEIYVNAILKLAKL